MVERVLYGGLPALVVGTGPPMVLLAGLQAEHREPTGFERFTLLRLARPLAEEHAVHVVGQPPGLVPGTTMADLAAAVAAMIRSEFGGAVPVMGTSTGGSIALQLAIDAPDTVSRLVLVSSACRLGPAGREAQRRLADLTEAGRVRAAWAPLGTAMGTGPVSRRVLSAMTWLLAPLAAPDDPADMIATLRAEDAFDVTEELARITAPTLVVGGGRDGFYTRELFRETARRIPDARLLLYPRKGHGGVMNHRPALRAMVRFLQEEHVEP